MEPVNIPWRTLRAEVRGLSANKASAHILRRFGITKPPIDVLAIARAMGVEVFEQLGLGAIGEIDATATPPRIVVNASDAWVRKRFTMAHELGHLMMHQLGKQFRETSFARPADTLEVQANEFAAGLLMPYWMLQRTAGVKRTPVYQLSALFQVSQPAMIYQLEKLL